MSAILARMHGGVDAATHHVDVTWVLEDGEDDKAGAVLFQHYNTPEKVDALIAKGTIERVVPNVDDVRSTHPKVRRIESFQEFRKGYARQSTAENVYLFHPLGVWFERCTMCHAARWLPWSVPRAPDCTMDSDSEVALVDDLLNTADEHYTWVPLNPHMCGLTPV